MGDVGNSDSIEIENLTARKNRGNYFVFFRSSQNEFGMEGGSSNVFRNALKAEGLNM